MKAKTSQTSTELQEASSMRHVWSFLICKYGEGTHNLQTLCIELCIPFTEHHHLRMLYTHPSDKYTTFEIEPSQRTMPMVVCFTTRLLYIILSF